MIMVDIYVPALDKEYDFRLNPNVEIKTIIEEVSEMIAHKEHSAIAGRMEELMLCDKMTGRILDGKKTLGACLVRTGSKLILV